MGVEFNFAAESERESFRSIYNEEGEKLSLLPHEGVADISILLRVSYASTYTYPLGWPLRACGGPYAEDESAFPDEVRRYPRHSWSVRPVPNPRKKDKIKIWALSGN